MLGKRENTNTSRDKNSKRLINKFVYAAPIYLLQNPQYECWKHTLFPTFTGPGP